VKKTARPVPLGPVTPRVTGLPAKPNPNDEVVRRALLAASAHRAADLAKATGLPEGEVLDALERLVSAKRARFRRPVTDLGPKEPLRFEAVS